ncbi:hypothetical protein N7468_001721 [Penicillium chermesinum]|uniref:Protein kinase domain-containing protein n=1 Tax=Penicillium chermesinum TaxID=63820 RepID=A0A9W9PH49_9EURO|nr:uncharacterized protein N7468_001721 [Penicillium chermesinum]KAJ5246738.1 hypothetical protein N7468_001721 [Penicillium chermesinum]KAJ6145005.1 hypothetical protein N7470_008900 [Penicillium chermesinum]
MSGVEPLAIFGAVDLCLKYGGIIVSKYKAFQLSGTEIEERALAIEAAWMRISQQLDFLKRVWESLDKAYQELQARILSVLERKLADSFDRRKAIKYVYLKDTLFQAVQNLQEWQKEFDTTWFLILLMADSAIDSELKKRTRNEKLSTARHIRRVIKPDSSHHDGNDTILPQKDFESAEVFGIPFSSFKKIKISKGFTFILDPSEVSDSRVASKLATSILARDVRNLATKLREVDPNEFHLLKCHGVVPKNEPGTQRLLAYDFIFDLPQGDFEPRSLRGLLLSKMRYTLGERIRLAQQFATAIHYIHILDFVHKRVRPENVMILPTRNDPSCVGQLFLLGFQEFRAAEGKTLRLGHSDWSHEIYQHPDRQGDNISEDYYMQHDIYSLGVCLLEIGLWGSLINHDGTGNTSLIPSAQSKGLLLQKHFLSLAEQELPLSMGDKYAKVVVNCLSSMKTSNLHADGPSEFEDENGFLIGIKFIEKRQNG